MSRTLQRAARRVGAQRPSQWCAPEAKSSAAPEAIELAAACGLELDDWQQWVLTKALGERANGKWAAVEVGLIVPRQNGKNAILEALELLGLTFGRLNIIHSAHKFDAARNHFDRMVQLIESNDDVRKLVKNVYTANGKESIAMRDGATLRFVARSRGAVRSRSSDLVVLDEAFDLPQTAIGAMMPSLSARPNPQIWYTSSAPHADSAVLHGVRERAVAGRDKRLAFFEWGNEANVDPEDRDAWYLANPGLGIRIEEDFIERELIAMSSAEFARERLGVPEVEDMAPSAVDFAAWEACCDPHGQIEHGLVLALDVAPDRAWASIAAAGYRSDGVLQVEVVDRREGTRWVVGRAAELVERWGGPIVLDPRSQTGGLLSALKLEGVEVKEISTLELSQGCAAFLGAISDQQVRHIGQRPLDLAIAGAATRTLGESWAWSRISSQVDISPLVACTLAFSQVGSSELSAGAITAELAVH